MKKLVFVLVALCGLWLYSCSQRTDYQVDEQPLYFRIADTLGMQKAEVYNPWQKGELLGRYYLVADSTAEVPADGMRLQVTLQRIARIFFAPCKCLCNVSPPLRRHISAT